MSRAAVRLAFSSLVACASLLGRSPPADAAVTANDATFMFPLVFDDPLELGEPSTVTISLNVTENNNGMALPLVSGSPRPLQLIDAVSDATQVMVTRFRNCITATFTAPGPPVFKVMYTMADGSNPGVFATATGFITFVGSETATYVSPQDTNCADSQFTAAAKDDSVQTLANQPVLIPVLSNDSPPAAPNHHVIFGAGARDNDVFQITTVNGATALAQPDQQIQYQPAANFIGTDSFSYILEDYAQPGFEGLNQTAMVTVSVLPGQTNPPPPPTAPPEVTDGQILVNGGTSKVVADSDSLPGETVTFEAAQADGSATTNLVNLDWYVGKETSPRQSGPSPKFTVALPDGQTDIRGVGLDVHGFSGMVTITVTVGSPPMMLSELPGLPPNQMGVAAALDRMCGGTAATDPASASLSHDQQDALARCNAIASADPASQMRALDELSAQDFNGTRTQTLLFTKSTYAGVSDRLGALRGGARGVSLRAMNVIIDGQSIPLTELQRIAGKLLGGGASADADEAGSLFGDKWGMWTRGNITFGGKSGSDADNGFQADQFSLVGGVDYRLSNDTAIGTALSFGSSKVSYNPIGEGGLDTESWALAFYGTSYLFKRAYLDAVLNIANSSYASQRHISYGDSLGLIDRNAKGSTDGFTWSGGLSGGYDFVFKGLTVSPSGSVFYSDSGINSFSENGAGGLNLAYADQSFQSMTATVGLRINYAFTLPFGVLMPYLRSDFVHELDAKVAIFNVRFVNDLDSSSAPITVQSAAPDQSYWRLSGGVSAQLPLGFAGYVEYQRLESLELVKFQDLALGLRMQYRF